MTASAFSLPERTCGKASGVLTNANAVCPAIRSVTACGALLYGTCTAWMPVSDFSISPERWFDAPLPNDAKLSCPGLLRASATSSAALFTPRAGWTTSRFGTEAISVIGLKSRSASNGSLA